MNPSQKINFNKFGNQVILLEEKWSLFDFSIYSALWKIRCRFSTNWEHNQTIREKDKMKEDVIANLSDTLIMLSERLDTVEGKIDINK